MKVYSCSGWAFDDAGAEGQLYFRTKADALAAARHATIPDETHEGSEATVIMHEVPPITHDMVVALLNHTGWCPRSETIAFVRNGRVADAP